MVFKETVKEGLSFQNWISLGLLSLTLLGMILGGTAVVYSRPSEEKVRKIVKETAYSKEKGVELEVTQRQLLEQMRQLRRQQQKILEQIKEVRETLIECRFGIWKYRKKKDKKNSP